MLGFARLPLKSGRTSASSACSVYSETAEIEVLMAGNPGICNKMLHSLVQLIFIRFPEGIGLSTLHALALLSLLSFDYAVQKKTDRVDPQDKTSLTLSTPQVRRPLTI